MIPNSPHFQLVRNKFINGVCHHSTLHSQMALKLSANETVCSVFHIKNHCASYQDKVRSFPGKLLTFQNNQTYLGITPGKRLTFKYHILKLKNKVWSEVTLKTASWVLAVDGHLTCSEAWQLLWYKLLKNIAPKVTNSTTRDLDSQLKEAMRTILGWTRPTLIDIPFRYPSPC